MKVICISKCKFQTFTIEPGEWLEVYQESSDYSRTNGDFGTYTFERNGYEYLCKRDHFPPMDILLVLKFLILM